MSFELSDTVNSAKVFLTPKSELSSRWDPTFAIYRRRVHGFKFPVRRLSQLFAEPPKYGAGERGIVRYSAEQPRYVRITDINEYGNLSDELGATADTVETQYILEDGDLLVARSGATVGKAYIYDAKSHNVVLFYAGYLIRLRFDIEKVLPRYVFAIMQLRYYKEWVRAVQRAAGQPNINAQEYSDFEIPSPPLNIQQQIVTHLGEAYLAKAEKDKDAKSILAGIDALLLEELGIPTLAEPDNAIENRMFLRKSSTVTGNRFDASSSWRRLSLKTDKFPMRVLKSVAAINPLTKLPQVPPETLVSFVPMDAVSETFGEIKDRLSRPLSECKAYTVFQDGDVLVAKITPCMENGKSALAENLNESFGFGSTEFHVFRPKAHELNADYLHLLLRLKVIRDHARLFFTGTSGHQRVDEQFYRRLEIPVPPMEAQIRIAKTAATMKDEARGLFKDAEEELEKAKRSIETMILG